MKTIKFLFAAALAVALLAASCSSSSSDSEDGYGSTTTSQSVTAPASTVPATTASSVLPAIPEVVSVVVPFTSGNGFGSVTVSGDSSPVAGWFANQPGEVSLDLVDADVEDAASVVEELISFWYFQDGDSGDTPPTIFESASGEITDSLSTRYVVEAQGLPPAPVAETTTTTSSATSSTTTSSTTSAATTEEPATSEPSTTTTTSTATSAAPVTTTTTTVVESPVTLQVQVLNGSGVAGAAGRMTDKLSEAGYVVLSPENAPQRYSSSAVYYQDGWQDRAKEILAAAEIEEIEVPTAMPQQFATEDAAVVVLLGTDTAPAVARKQADLRPRQRNDVTLPLPASTPRDRYVSGLAAVNIYTPQTDSDEYTFALAHTLQGWIRFLGNHAQDYIFGVIANERGNREQVLQAYETIEGILSDLGFTPQNVCGAPAGYSLTDLLQPTREWDNSTKTYGGDAIFTTDRLLELHGGEQINPEANLDFYINQAVQTAHDMLRLPELLDETEAPQLVLCAAWLAPSGEVPEFSNAAWYALLTPGIQPQESLLSQGTYHVKEISKNGNNVYLVVCHPTIGARFVYLWWREAGYRAEIVEDIRTGGCQAAFEEYDYLENLGGDESIKFAFGERTFSAASLSAFPRG